MSPSGEHLDYPIARLRSESEIQYIQYHEDIGDFGQNDEGKVVVVQDCSGGESSPLFIRKELPTKPALQNEANIMHQLDLKDPTKHRVKIEGAFTIGDDRFFLIVSPFAKDKDLWAMLMNIVHGTDVQRRKELQALLQKTMGCLAVGLAALHEDGFRHRDLHPGNVLFHNEEVLFCDFGASRYIGRNTRGTTHTRRPPRMDRYAPPEVISTRESVSGGHNNASDVFSLGAVLYEIYYAIFDPQKLDHLSDGGWRYSSECYGVIPSWENDIARLRTRFFLHTPLITLPSMLRAKKRSRPSALKVAADIYTAQQKLGISFMCEDCECWIQKFGHGEIASLNMSFTDLWFPLVLVIMLLIIVGTLQGIVYWVLDMNDR